MTVATDDLRSVKDQRRMTLREYLDYDDGTDIRYELEDGVLVEMGAENPLNPCIAAMLMFLFGDLGISRKLLAIGHQIEVSSRYVTARQPDLVVHTPESDEALFSGEKVLRLGSPSPLLVLEVASQTKTDAKSRKRDYEQKPREYADRGIPEMWIVDPDRDWVMVGTLIDQTYLFQTFQRKMSIVSPTFPELNLTATQVLSAGR